MVGGKFMVNKKTEKKSGFSLFEALVSMLILSLFFIASSKVITQKQPVEVQKNPHGYYECYYYGGSLWQHRANGNASTPAARTNNCAFQPPSGVTFINVHYYNNTEYYNSQQVIMNMPVQIGQPSNINMPGLFTNGAQTGTDALYAFMTFLKLAHPNSKIYQNWKNGVPPSQAVMITW